MNTKKILKRADAYDEAIQAPIIPTLALASLPGLLSPLGLGALAVPGVVGHIHGATARLGDPIRELKNMNNSGPIPGLYSSRSRRRERLVHKLLYNKKKHSGNSDSLSRITNLSLLNPLNALAYPVAATLAAATPGHTPAERAEAINDPDRTLKTLLIPGYGTYQKYKDIGLSNRLEDLEATVAKLVERGDLATAKQYKKYL